MFMFFNVKGGHLYSGHLAVYLQNEIIEWMLTYTHHNQLNRLLKHGFLWVEECEKAVKDRIITSF